MATVALNPFEEFLQTISLDNTGCCPTSADKYSCHVHNDGTGGESDSRLTGYKFKILKITYHKDIYIYKFILYIGHYFVMHCNIV